MDAVGAPVAAQPRKDESLQSIAGHATGRWSEPSRAHGGGHVGPGGANTGRAPTAGPNSGPENPGPICGDTAAGHATLNLRWRVIGVSRTRPSAARRVP